MEMICRDCGTLGAPVKDPRGKPNWFVFAALMFLGVILAFVYLFFLLPYSSKRVCGTCGSTALVGTDTPVGYDLVRRLAPRP